MIYLALYLVVLAVVLRWNHVARGPRWPDTALHGERTEDA